MKTSLSEEYILISGKELDLHLDPRGLNWKYLLLNWEKSSTHVLKAEGEIKDQNHETSLELEFYSEKKTWNLSPKTGNKPIHCVLKSDTCLWENSEEMCAQGKNNSLLNKN